jgi:hypothetical protein
MNYFEVFPLLLPFTITNSGPRNQTQGRLFLSRKEAQFLLSLKHYGKLSEISSTEYRTLLPTAKTSSSFFIVDLSMSSFNSYSIEKLKGNNWHAWKLKSNAVHLVMTFGRLPIRRPIILGPKAYSKITLLIDSDQLVYINATENAREALKAL